MIDPSVRELVERLAPGIDLPRDVADLGGCMSLNLHLRPAGVVLRVHPRYVSRSRLAALHNLRRWLRGRGLLVAEPLDLVPCGGRWAEIEPFIPHSKPTATVESYRWMYDAIGRLHRELSVSTIAVPRPRVATYGPPRSLRRWLSQTRAAVEADPIASEIVDKVATMIRLLERRWIPATRLPVHLIHGDVRLGNVGITPNGQVVYLDFGFSAMRPRIFELAYSLIWIIFRPDGLGSPKDFDWTIARNLLQIYQDAAGVALGQAEYEAFIPHVASIPLYQIATAALAEGDPRERLHEGDRQRFLRISEQILTTGENTSHSCGVNGSSGRYQFGASG